MKVLFITISIILLSEMAHGLAQSRLIPYNGNKYYFGANSETATWYEAKQRCKDMNMNLIEIRTVEEYMRFMDIIDTNGLGNLGWTWGGGSDEGHEGTWKWVSDDTPFAFTKWYPPHPTTKVGNTENCLCIMGNAYNYQWNDLICTLKYPFNCFGPGTDEVPTTTQSPTTTTAAAPTTTAAATTTTSAATTTSSSNTGPAAAKVFVTQEYTVNHLAKTYYLYPLQLNFYMARNFCLQKNLRLVEFRTLQEILDFKAALYTISEGTIDTETWVGLSDEGSEGQFYWISNGDANTFDHYRPGEPNNVNNYGFLPGENCIAAGSGQIDYQWNDIPCLHVFPFVCENY